MVDMNEEVKQIVGEVEDVAEIQRQSADQKKRGTNQKKGAKEPARKRVKVEEEKKAEKALVPKKVVRKGTRARVMYQKGECLLVKEAQVEEEERIDEGELMVLKVSQDFFAPKKNNGEAELEVHGHRYAKVEEQASRSRYVNYKKLEGGESTVNLGQVIGTLTKPNAIGQGSRAKADVLSFPKGDINKYFAENQAREALKDVGEIKPKPKAAPLPKPMMIEGAGPVQVQEPPKPNKREKKAAAKAKPKKQALLPREDIPLPISVPTWDSTSKDLLEPHCCQTCANRNVYRAALVDSQDLFLCCLKSRAQVSSLIEKISPEVRITALEAAIRLNRKDMLTAMLDEQRLENEYRVAKSASQITKYDTGEVGEMAFGYKVRKVNMMRGNRQGNNAFLEDPVHPHQTPLIYLMSSGNGTLEEAFGQDTVEVETLKVIKKAMGEVDFLKLVEEQLVPILMRKGCVKTIEGLFELLGISEDNTKFFSKTNKILLFGSKDQQFAYLTPDDLQGQQKLFSAALNPSGKALEVFLAHGVDITLGTKETGYIQHYAAVCATAASIQFLEEHKLSLFSEDVSKKTPLMWWATSAHPSKEVLDLLLSSYAKAQIDAVDTTKYSALHHFCMHHNIASKDAAQWVVEALIVSKKAKMTQVAGWDKHTPLGLAATSGDAALVEAMVELVPRLNLNKGDKYGRTPLLMAARNGHANIVALLMKHHAKASIPDTSGNTPLHYAAAYGRLECVHVLLQYSTNGEVEEEDIANALTSAENSWKATPITIALQKNHTAIVRELLKTGTVNVNSKDDEGRTLLSLALSSPLTADSVSFIESLLNQRSHQVDVNAQDAKGQSPLYHLVQKMIDRRKKAQKVLFGGEETEKVEYHLVEMLLAHGAELTMKAKDDKSPFTLAFEGGLLPLLKRFGSQIDLNTDPSLFFAFSGASILRKSTHEILYESMKNVPAGSIQDESINHVNDQGFTPLLWYLHHALQVQPRILQATQDLLDKRQATSNETILPHFEEREGKPWPQLVVTPQAHKVYETEIIEPLIDFINQVLLRNGASPNAHVMKVKAFREEAPAGLSLSQKTTSTQTLANIMARKPPEKEQYMSEALGLSNALHMLIDTPQTKIFQFLVSLEGIGGEVGLLNQVNFQKMSPFFKLVKTKSFKEGDYKVMFDALLATGQVQIDSTDQFGMSAFWYLYSNKRLDDALYLVQQFGANINHIDNYGTFALKRELFDNNLQGFTRLLDQGQANPDMRDEFQRSCLHLACDFAHRRDYTEFFKALMKHSADLAALDFKQRTPLRYLYIKKNKRHEIDEFDPLPTLKLLLTQATSGKFSPALQDIHGQSFLHAIAQRGSWEALEYLITLYGTQGLDINQRNHTGNTVLGVAVECRHQKFVEKVIEHFKGAADLKVILHPENRQPKPRQMMAGGFGGGQDDEGSDFEYMELQQQQQAGFFAQQGQISLNSANGDHPNLFRYILRLHLAGLEQVFIAKGNYDRLQMLVDYICEGQIQKIIHMVGDGSANSNQIITQKNAKGQSLLHVLARNAHLVASIADLTAFHTKLSGLLSTDAKDSLDGHGRTVLHLAIKSGNQAFVKFLVEVQGADVNIRDARGRNALCTLIFGDRILTAQPKLLEYLLQRGCSPNVSYTEKRYGALDYHCTPVIHAIRHESKDRTNIRIVLKTLLDKGADPNAQDSLGRDALIYCVTRNHANTFDFILSSFSKPDEESKGAQLKLNSVDKLDGRSLIHYIVDPLPFGSFENEELLRQALAAGFDPLIRDAKGFTPYEYALKQKSGVLKNVFEEVIGLDKLQAAIQDRPLELDQILPLDQKEQDQVDFEADAQAYLYEIQMQLDPHKFVPCDPAGKFSDDCVVMFDDGSEAAESEEEKVPKQDKEMIDLGLVEDEPMSQMIGTQSQRPMNGAKGTQQHFDVYLTRVQIGKFQPGGDYVFYRMQLVIDRSRDLPILFTRWGRIGEEGAFQKTPFSTIAEAVSEFKKVFEQKTGCRWCPKDKFHKKFGKFQLMRSNYVTLDQQNYLVPFTHEQETAPTNLSQQALETLHNICDAQTYLKALKASGVDPKAMPFSQLDRKNLYNALDVLQSLEKTIKKIEEMNPRPFAEAEKNKLLQLREKMWYLSSRFYEFIPHEEFRNKMVPPISNLNQLIQKSSMLHSLIQIEMASKILLGGLNQGQKGLNPLEYCLRATGVSQFDVLPQEDPEYRVLRENIQNTYYEILNINAPDRYLLRHIVRLNKPSEFRDDLPNRRLLYHGSRTPNFLGILAQGMRVSPMEVQQNGNLLGKGIYFSDLLFKSIQYTGDVNRAVGHGQPRYVLICEVALGKCQEVSRMNNQYVIPEGFNSVQGLGRQGTDDSTSNMVTLPDGARLSLGKSKLFGDRDRSDFQFNEFVVPDPSQVKLRYLLEFR